MIVALAGSVSAAPNSLRFQGRLTDSGGRPIFGTPEVKFEIYDDPTGGTRAWGPSPYQKVNSNEAGLFSVDVDMGAGGSAVFANSGDLYLQVTVKSGTGGLDQILSPRQRLSTVPFAFYSQVASSATVALSVPDNSIITSSIQDGAITSSKIQDRSVMGINLATNTITSANIVDGSIKNVDLEDDTITPDKMNVSSFTTAGWIVPSGAIFMFLGPGCPEGYDEVTELRNRVAMGADIANTDPDVPNETGQTFGSKTHTHNIAHSHFTGFGEGFSNLEDIGTPQDMVYFSHPKEVSGVAALANQDYVQLKGVDHVHVSTTQSTTDSSAALTIPPAYTVLFCRKR